MSTYRLAYLTLSIGLLSVTSGCAYLAADDSAAELPQVTFAVTDAMQKRLLRRRWQHY